MEDTLLTEKVNAVAEVLREANAQDVSVLDLRRINNWTDFFVIATASSKIHMDGLEKHVKDFCFEKEIEILRRPGLKKPSNNPDEEWRIIDLGWAVIHLMNSRAREFYDLERLWRDTSSL